MLRYKLVDNFTTEDNISNFLTQLLNKQILRDEDSMKKIVAYLAEEFQLDNDTAKNKIQNWFVKKDEVQQIIVGETKEYTPTNNSGVDIFSKQKIYLHFIYIM